MNVFKKKVISLLCHFRLVFVLFVYLFVCLFFLHHYKCILLASNGNGAYGSSLFSDMSLVINEEWSSRSTSNNR